MLNVWTQVIPASRPEQGGSGGNQPEVTVTNVGTDIALAFSV
jgi:hypothetical protein